jgi:hypothetical protein
VSAESHFHSVAVTVKTSFPNYCREMPRLPHVVLMRMKVVNYAQLLTSGIIKLEAGFEVATALGRIRFSGL